MNELSQRAQNFLDKHSREPSILLEDEIIEVLRANGSPIFKPVVDFQKKYSGYIFYSGLEPIHFGILLGGGYPNKTDTATVEFYSEDNGNNLYQFVCATTQYQMDFTIDQNGLYYENGEVIASSFDKCVEHLSIWDELKMKGFEIICRDKRIQFLNLDENLGLDIIKEASDEFTLWFKNDLIYMSQRKGLTDLFVAKEKRDLKLQLIDLVS